MLCERSSFGPATFLTVKDRGLGVGTSAGALIAHGVNTTSVEIDPRVRDYATSYFGLDADHTSVIEDAVSFVDRAVQENRRYDYIIHDVFTGGAEPVHLFTIEFIKSLHDLLESEGAIAIVSTLFQHSPLSST